MPAKQSHFTQWAAQFAVASELCKRGYLVALTLGNHPSVDLMVKSPEGRQFEIDVKGLYKKNFFLLNPDKGDTTNLFYVLAYVPEDEENEFFVMTQADAVREAHAETDRLRRNQVAKGKAPTAGSMPGIPWAIAQNHKNRWKEVLPA